MSDVKEAATKDTLHFDRWVRLFAQSIFPQFTSIILGFRLRFDRALSKLLIELALSKSLSFLVLIDSTRRGNLD